MIRNSKVIKTKLTFALIQKPYLCIEHKTKNMEKIIGTHNTMSYLPPKHWWQKPINYLFGQCQTWLSTYQYKHKNNKAVDIRLVWNKKHGWEYAHGLVKYRSDISVLALIDAMRWMGVKYFRLILERDGGEAEFQCLCRHLSHKYSKCDVTFIGGYRKSDWEHLYDFGTNDIPIHQWVGSMADDARWYERFIPRLYAKRMNRKNMENLKEGINLFDFI